MNVLLDYPKNAFPVTASCRSSSSSPRNFCSSTWKQLDAPRGCKANRFQIACQLTHLPSWFSEIKADAFMLNVIAAINIFARPAEPISHAHRVSE